MREGLRHEQIITVLTLVRDPVLTPAAADISSDVWRRCHLAWYVWTWATTQGTLGVTHVIIGCFMGMRSGAGLM